MAVDFTPLNANSINNINTNFQRVDTALQDAVSRSGTNPNHMDSDFDMNSNDILNVGLIDADSVSINGIPIGQPLTNFKGDWNGVDTYVINDIVRYDDILWIAKRGNTNVVPVEGDDWTLFLEASSGIADGVYGDVVVSDSGETWTVPKIADGDKGDLYINGSLFTLKKQKDTVALAIADDPTVDPDYYDIAYYDSNRAIQSGGLYKKVAVEPTHTGKFQNANGTWYELNEAIVTPQMLGYVSGNVSTYVSAAFDVSTNVYLPRYDGYTATSSFSKAMTKGFKFDGNKQLVLFNHQITWEFKGTQIISSGSYLYSSSRTRYQTTVLVNSLPGVQVGDLFYVNNAGQAPMSGWGDTKKECILITGVPAADQLTLAAGLNFNWNLVDTSNVVEIWRPVTADFIDINFRINNPVNSQAHYMLHLIGLRDIKIVRPRLTAPIAGFDRVTQFHRMGIQIWKCWNWSVSDAYYEGLAYPLGIYGGTRNGFETNSHAYYCRHGHADLGDFASDYHLVGLVSDSCYGSISTHPCFRAYATNFTVTNDVDIINWRCIGGGLSNGVAHDLSSDSGQSPQFHSEAPASGFSYIYEDADFYVTNVNFNNKLRTATNPPFKIVYGRHAHIDNITVPALSAFTTWTLIQLLSVGIGVVSMTGTAFRGPGKYAAGVVQP